MHFKYLPAMTVLMTAAKAASILPVNSIANLTPSDILLPPSTNSSEPVSLDPPILSDTNLVGWAPSDDEFLDCLRLHIRYKIYIAEQEVKVDNQWIKSVINHNIKNANAKHEAMLMTDALKKGKAAYADRFRKQCAGYIDWDC